MSWKKLTRAVQLATFLGVLPYTLRAARRQISYVYVEREQLIKKKLRNLCYPPRESELYVVQSALKDKCLSTLPLCDVVRGYRSGQHNVNCSEVVAGFPYVAKIDIRDFHPSLSPVLVRKALLRFQVSEPMCRLITQLVTYKNQVPQGAPTSNHIANVVVDMVLADGVLYFCKDRDISVVNFGDDTAFGGTDQKIVDECVEFAKRAFAKYGLVANSKSSSAEHVGASRKFIGTNTGREKPDLPRKKFREYRSELRAALNLQRGSAVVLVDQKQMRSFRSKIGYVRRLNTKKARTLSNDFFRLCRVRIDKLMSR